MRRSRSRLFGIALAFVAAIAYATPAAASAVPLRQLDWRDCANAPGFQCTTLQVPVDYDIPNGSQIGLAVIRKPATDQAHRIGSLLFNPGGPGGSGLDSLPVFYPLFPAAARARFDLVSFDPRGIGQTAPLKCFATPEEEAALLGQLPAAFPVGADQQQKWIDVYAQFDQACAHNGGPILEHMSTANVARDMDRLRAALGDGSLTYYGPSYGSYLGSTYANLFPSRTRAMVLDGNVDAKAWNDKQTGQFLGTFLREGSDLGSAATLRQFLSKCGAVGTNRCAFSAGSPEATRAKYETLLNLLRDKPVVIGPTVVTYDFAVLLTTNSLYAQNAILGLPVGWQLLAANLQLIWSNSTATGVAAASLRLPSQLSGLLAPALAPLPEQQFGVFCSESPNPRDPHAYPRQAAFADRRSPIGEGSIWTWVAEACAQWPVIDADRYTGPFHKPTAPLLLIGMQNDPATPYQASVLLSMQLANARLLTVTGGGHTTLLNKSDCADAAIDNYLVSGTLPPPGTVCAQNQEPF